jgi:hypothetical protein
MYALMFFQIARFNERHFTDCTGIRALSTVYALMTYQVAFYTESLLTHITIKRALSGMRVKM